MALKDRSPQIPDAGPNAINITNASNQNDWNVGVNADTTVFLNGNSTYTITGVMGGILGRRMVLKNTGTGIVTLPHNSGSSTTGNKLINITNGDVSLCTNGVAIYVHNGTNWHMEHHDQGAPIAWTPTDASGATLSFSAATGSYIVQGRQVYVSLFVTYPVNGSSSATKISLPFTAVGSYDGALATAFCNQASAGVNVLVRASTATCELVFTSGTTVTNTNMGTGSGKTIDAAGVYVIA